MFKITIHKGDFIVEIESDSIISDEDNMRKLIDDITEKFNHSEGINVNGLNVSAKKLSESTDT